MIDPAMAAALDAAEYRAFAREQEQLAPPVPVMRDPSLPRPPDDPVDYLKHNPAWVWVSGCRTRFIEPGTAPTGPLDVLVGFGWLRDVTEPGGRRRYELTAEGRTAARAAQRHSWPNDLSWVV